jgi:hypothetical protein
MPKQWQLVPLISIVTFASMPTDVASQTVVVNFTAEVTYINDAFCQCLDTVKVGDVMYGTYVYELGAPDSEPSPREGRYQYSAPPAGMSINLLSHSFQSNPNDMDFYVVVLDSVNGSAIDRYHNSEYNVIDVNRPWLWVGGMGIALVDSTGTALDDDTLPAQAPNLDDWPHLRKVVVSGDFDIQADITAISTAQIPTLSRSVMIALVLLVLSLGIVWIKLGGSSLR